MIDPSKIFQLKGGQKRRKLALCFGSLERDIAGIAEKGTEYDFPQMPRREYIKNLVNILFKDPKLSPAAQGELQNLLNEDLFDERRVCNCAKNHLLAILGTFPAEWDLVIAPHSAPGLHGTVKKRFFYPGVFIYAEDIRSPFNIGSIFRTAEAMGAQKIFISPGCTDPLQPRAVRSGMGCIETLEYEKRALSELPKNMPVFVLETGGTDITDFVFPKQGICIIGSEELGVSPQALKTASYGRVTIPMKGLKASLNVGVALGILMQKWTEFLDRADRAAAVD